MGTGDVKLALVIGLLLGWLGLGVADRAARGIRRRRSDRARDAAGDEVARVDPVGPSMLAGALIAVLLVGG